MKDTIEVINLNEIYRGAKIAANPPGSYAAYVDLSNMVAGDAVAFWLEYDVTGEDAPRKSGPFFSETYESLITIWDEGGAYEETLMEGVKALEPISLELNQVSQIAFSQTAGTPKTFEVRNTLMQDGT